jgi:hypothetical protein
MFSSQGLAVSPISLTSSSRTPKPGRQIEAGYFYGSDPGALIPDIVRKRLAAIFTGVSRVPGADLCVASAVWAR